jgi:transcriptional regulator with XRE-family HTH domain
VEETPSRDDAILRAWGRVIRRYRHWRQLSRRELAERSGLSVVYLGEIERGEKDPSSHSLCLVAGALGVSLAELYLRVAATLDLRSAGDDTQHALPLAVRETRRGVRAEYPTGVSLVSDETAFDLYEIARQLRTDQQLSLLVLARTLLPEK